jgi:hypothetical protein
MDLTDELQKLAALHEQGHLTDEEFSAAKARLLNAEPVPSAAPPRSGFGLQDAFGDAANRLVQIEEQKLAYRQVSGIIGAVILIGFLLFVFLPLASHVNAAERQSPLFRGVPGTTSTDQVVPLFVHQNN